MTAITRLAMPAILAIAFALTGCDDGPSERDMSEGDLPALPPSDVRTETTPQSGTGGIIPGNNPQLIEGRQNVATPKERAD